MKSRIALCFVLVSALAAACGGGQPEAAAPSNPSAEADAAAPAASAAPAESAAPAASAAPSAAPATPPGPPGPGDWANWSHEQKLAYMKSTVMPKMGEAFTTYDAKKYAEPKCVLCHGGGVADGTFKMPNPDLPVLDVSPAGIKKMHSDPKKKKVLEFMGKVVVPTMAGLLGEPPFDMKTMTGFGCLNCHTKKEPAIGAKGAKKDAASKDAGPATAPKTP
jgi:hypothetical protein